MFLCVFSYLFIYLELDSSRLGKKRVRQETNFQNAVFASSLRCVNEVWGSSAGPSGQQGAGVYRGLAQRLSRTLKGRCSRFPGPQHGPGGCLPRAGHLDLASEAPLETFPMPSQISRSCVLVEHFRSAATSRKGRANWLSFQTFPLASPYARGLCHLRRDLCVL